MYFRPGGWRVNLSATAARIACAAAILAAGFQIAGLEDLDREVIVATAGLVASMDVRPVRLRRRDRRLADALRQNGLAGVAVSADAARGALPGGRRREVSADEVADALDRLVAAGVADPEGVDEWIVRAPGSEAWLRVSLRGSDN